MCKLLGLFVVVILKIQAQLDQKVRYFLISLNLMFFGCFLQRLRRKNRWLNWFVQGCRLCYLDLGFRKGARLCNQRLRRLNRKLIIHSDFKRGLRPISVKGFSIHLLVGLN